MGYAGRHNIYEGTIRRMVTQALEAQEETFRKEHGTDTEQQLTDYIRAWTQEHHHVPWPGEIPGGTVMAERFGSWEAALAAAGLGRPLGPNKSETFARVRQEEVRQKEIYRQRKLEKKELAKKRKARQAARRK